MDRYRAPVSAELAAFIQERIARYVTECAANLRWLVPYVEKHNVMPLVVGWTETIGIMANGCVRKFSADGELTEYEGLREPGNFSEYAAALVQGAARHSVLAETVPARPPNGITCPHCGGSGKGPANLICTCGGIGWVVEGVA